MGFWKNVVKSKFNTINLVKFLFFLYIADCFFFCSKVCRHYDNGASATITSVDIVNFRNQKTNVFVSYKPS